MLLDEDAKFDVATLTTWRGRAFVVAMKRNYPHGALLALGLFVLACGAPPEPTVPLASSPTLMALAWLSGAWVHESGEERSEEHWTEPRGGTLLGMNRTVEGGRTVHSEQLRIEQRPDGIFYVAKPSNQPPAEFRLVSSGESQAVFENLAHDFPQRISYRRDGGALFARVEGRGAKALEWSWQRAGDARGDTRRAAPPVAREKFLEAGLAFGAPWKKGDAAALGLDVEVLDGIIGEAARTKSDSLLVIQDRQIVVERYFGKPVAPIETMSMTKSIVSLGIGMLIADGKIPSLDAPLSTWFEDWKTGPKAKVTLRHVLTHTSGLEHRQGARVLNQQDDRFAFVRKSPVVEEPGARFSYSNEAVQLLSGVALAAGEQPLDLYLAERLFAPLGIATHSWDKDAAGNVQTFYGLALSARDLARIGQLMLQRGQWNGKQLVPAAWIDESTRAAGGTPYHGLLWWIRSGRGRVSLSADKLGALGPGLGDSAALVSLAGRAFPTHAALWMEVGTRLDEAGRARLSKLIEQGSVPFVEEPGTTIGFAADGWLGQQLIVLPAHRVIVVRQHRAPDDGSADDAYNKEHGFFDLIRRIESALPPVAVSR